MNGSLTLLDDNLLYIAFSIIGISSKNEQEMKFRGRGHTGQVGATTNCSHNKHVGRFLYFKLPKLPVQVKSRPIKDVTKYVLNTDLQFTN